MPGETVSHYRIVRRLGAGSLGLAYGTLGNMDKAFAYFEEAYARKIPWMARLGCLPYTNDDLAPLLQEPRYHELMVRMGIPTPAPETEN